MRQKKVNGFVFVLHRIASKLCNANISNNFRAIEKSKSQTKLKKIVNDVMISKIHVFT